MWKNEDSEKLKTVWIAFTVVTVNRIRNSKPLALESRPHNKQECFPIIRNQSKVFESSFVFYSLFIKVLFMFNISWYLPVHWYICNAGLTRKLLKV